MRQKPLTDFSIAQRMSWAALRETTRKEDEAYCLLGIFGVNMPLLYGEEEKAFERLQEQIIRSHTDHSIFAWQLPGAVRDDHYTYEHRGPLASSPYSFQKCSNVVEGFKMRPNRPFQRNNLGISITLPLLKQDSRSYVAILQCYKQRKCLGLRLHWATPEDGSLEGEEDVFDLTETHVTRLAYLDVHEALKATKRSIVIRMGNSTAYQRNENPLDWQNATLWFRLKNCHKTHIYRVREVWPPDLWERCEEGPFQYGRGISIVAEYRGLVAREVGGIVLGDMNSSSRLALCFYAEAKAGTRRSKVTELGDRILEDLCTVFESQTFRASYVECEAPMVIEDVKDLDGKAEARIVMKPEKGFKERYGTALEVTIADPGRSALIQMEASSFD